MTDINRVQSVDDETKQNPVLPITAANLPTSNIYDGTLKYYAANLEWAQFIDGWMRWLASAAAWQDEEDESGHKITQITEFILGVDPVIDCEEVETCLETSATIAAILAAIAENDTDIATNAANIATNTANIATNTANIATNAANIATNAANIASNDADITNLQSQINTNIIAIGDLNNAMDAVEAVNTIQQADLANHEARLDALEAASGGGGGTGTPVFMITRETYQTVTWDSDQSQIEVDIPSDCIHVEIEFFGNAANAAVQWLHAYANDDFVNTNYQYSSNDITVNLPRIGRLASNAASAVPQQAFTRMILFNVADTTRRIMYADSSYFNHATSTSAGQSIVFNHAWMWESLSTLETITFRADSGDLEGGGFVRVIAVREREVLVDAGSTEFDWELTFDFSIDDYSEVFEAQQGEYASGEWRTDSGELDYVNIYMPEFGGALSDDLSVLQVQMTYFIETTSGGESIGFHATGFAAPDVYDSPTLDAEATYTFDYGETEQIADNFNFYASADDFSSTGAYAAIRKIVIRGIGTLPSELEPYA